MYVTWVLSKSLLTGHKQDTENSLWKENPVYDPPTQPPTAVKLTAIKMSLINV